MIPLTPLSPESNRIGKKYVVCDIESMNWTEFLVIGLYDGETFSHYKSIMSFLAELVTRKERLQVFAHFGGKFDFLFILEEALGTPGIVVDAITPRGSSILCFDLWDEKIGDKTKITFYDSAALLPFSLARCAESFGVKHQKLEWDHSKTMGITHELLKYLKHDCVALFEVIAAFREWELVKAAGPKNTVASQALQVFRLFLEEPIPSLKDSVDLFVRKSYFGGRTEVFRPHFKSKRGETLKCYDVNSLYPTVMLNYEYPTRFLGKTDIYEEGAMGFYDALVEVPRDLWVPPLGSVQKIGRSSKFVFPTGTFWGRWSTVELEYAKSVGVKVLKTGNGYLFQSGGRIFEKYIQVLYEKRLHAVRSGDLVTNILTKLLMNGLYGRFGMSREKENLVLDDGRDGIGGGESLEIRTPLGWVRLMTQAKRLENSFSNVAIAAWVTSLARIHMHRIYRNCGDDLYYTDTDSLFTTRELSTGEGLGEMKLEYEGREACFLLPKTYLVDGIRGEKFQKKVVMKGFQKRKIERFGIEDFENALEGEMRALRIEDPNPPGIMTFKSALRRGALVQRPGRLVREIRSRYDKRDLIRENGIYTTKPLYIHNLGYHLTE